jgi:hypothetical protein
MKGAWAESGNQLGIGDGTHAVGPSARSEHDVLFLSKEGGPWQARDAADERRVGLQNIHALSGDEFAKFVGLAGHFAASDTNIDRPPQRSHASVLTLMQRLFHPVHAQSVEFAGVRASFRVQGGWYLKADANPDRSRPLSRAIARPAPGQPRVL